MLRFRPVDYDNQTSFDSTGTVRGIVRRGRRYQLRVRLPALLARQTGRRELRLSLGTDNLREALRRGLPLLSRLEQLFFDLEGRNQMTEQTVNALTQAYRRHLSDELTPGQQAKLLSDLSPKEIDQAALTYQSLLDFDRQALRYGQFEHIAQTLDRFAQETNRTIDHDSPNYHLLLMQALQTRIQAFEIKLQCALGNYQNTTPLAAPQAAGAAEQSDSNKTIKEICDLYIDEKTTVDGAWNEQGTLPEVKRALKTFRELIGGDDIMVRTITRAMLNDYKTKLTKLPIQTVKRYKDKTATELLAMNVPEADRISKSNVNLHLKWVMALMDWADTNDHILKNPAKKLTIKRKSLEKNYKEFVQPYSDDEVRQIFEKITYNPARQERFWGPLIAAYTGARLDEVSQLLFKDVCNVNGVLCFKIILSADLTDLETKKKLKTQASKRNVPVHKDLLELGFEDYIKRLKAEKAIRLFPKLPPSKRGYGVELGKWYGREISNILFPDSKRKKVFNSFRHSIEDKYKNMPDMRDSMQQYLTGHTTGKEDFDRYGSDPLASILKVYVDRVDYGLDIEALKAKIKNPDYARRKSKRTTTGLQQPVKTTSTGHRQPTIVRRRGQQTTVIA